MTKREMKAEMKKIVEAAEAVVAAIDEGNEDECYHQIEEIEDLIKPFADFDFPTK